ncbi:hypothetical protein O3597_19430 [Verrucosispora sp. WMMA2044]|uniref:hypothetical protein n=1 Tax=Verrucosispora sp. WMMA2044 TaxID=3016419 RepID=UPI00248AA317|nr:hypothetical protein [Verrucosispora sp. WMMA2044]WBB47309.1 hypothetical protein O3597_19430 [Verrucosispora sp. WMMA2044]
MTFEFGYEIRECGLSDFGLDGTSDTTRWGSSTLPQHTAPLPTGPPSARPTQTPRLRRSMARVGRERKTEGGIQRVVNGHIPTVDDLVRAREVFGAHEPRDVFYRAATDLVETALRGAGSVSVAEAIAVLLQTWNRPYYQYRPADAAHFEAMERLLTRHELWLAETRVRSIDSMSDVDSEAVSAVFPEFEALLGPVGAAKALHLLAPCFLPLWDRRIAAAYGLGLGPVGTNQRRYVRFMQLTREQSLRVGGERAVGRNIIKALDEFNYCRFTKAWM